MKSHQHEIRGIHKWPLLGALAIVLLTLVLVVVSVAVNGPVATRADTNLVAERMLYFIDTRNGEVEVYDAKTRQKLGQFGPGEGAFVRISMRSLMRQRGLKEIDLTLPFRLVRRDNGDLSITDPHSGEHIRVNAFGPIAIRSFAQFLPTDYSEQGAEG